MTWEDPDGEEGHPLRGTRQALSLEHFSSVLPDVQKAPRAFVLGINISPGPFSKPKPI